MDCIVDLKVPGLDNTTVAFEGCLEPDNVTPVDTTGWTLTPYAGVDNGRYVLSVPTAPYGSTFVLYEIANPANYAIGTLTPTVVTPSPLTSTSVTPSYTVNDLCLGALKLLGIEEAGETSTFDDLNDALFFLNLLLDEWSIDRSKIYVRKEDIKVLTIGTGLYTIGEDVTADINSVMPIKIEQGFLRNLDLVVGSGYLDYYLDVTMQQEQYNEMPIKAIETIPTRLFFLKAWPVGSLYFDYLPNKAYEMHLFSWKPLQQFSSIQDIIQMPDGYKAAMTYNLAVIFAPAFGKQAPQTVIAKAQMLAQAISNKNYEIPRIKMQGIPGTRRIGGSIYNPFLRSGS